jgi:hypothetical protein
MAHVGATLDAVVALARRYDCEPHNRRRLNPEDLRGVSHAAIVQQLLGRLVVP